MTVFALPLRQDALVFDFFTTLSNVNYYFRFYFNQNDSIWRFDFADDNRVPIVSGVSVLINSIPLELLSDERAPPGVFTVVDLSSTHQEAGPTDLGTRVKVFYDDGVE